jgi:hypothetical protein
LALGSRKDAGILRGLVQNAPVKTTAYFREMRKRPDRAAILDEWITATIESPLAEAIQDDGRIRRWRRIPEMDNRALRVILLDDGETVHNAFFDRRFRDDEG